MERGGYTAHIPNYPATLWSPCYKMLLQRWQEERPDVIYLATEGPMDFLPCGQQKSWESRLVFTPILISISNITKYP